MDYRLIAECKGVIAAWEDPSVVRPAISQEPPFEVRLAIAYLAEHPPERSVTDDLLVARPTRGDIGEVK